MKTFLSQYTTSVRKTNYPGTRHHNKYFTTGTRVYHCINITEHLPRYHFQFGRYLRIRYDSHPKPTTNTDDNNKPQDTPPPYQSTSELQQQLQQDELSKQTSEDETQSSDDETQQELQQDELSQQTSENETQSSDDETQIPETQQELQQDQLSEDETQIQENTPIPNAYDTPNIETNEQSFKTVTRRRKKQTDTPKTIPNAYDTPNIPKTIPPDNKSINWWASPLDTRDDVTPKYEYNPNELYRLITRQEQKIYYLPAHKNQYGAPERLSKKN